MNIPLDNLYHYVNGLFTDPVSIYLFYPHGSRNILDIVNLNKDHRAESIYMPIVLCHDQEPLNYSYYQNHNKSDVDYVLKNERYSGHDAEYKAMLTNSNLKLTLYSRLNLYNKIILIHSEKNSSDLDKYINDGFVGVFYWSHAVIAKDWYRFAEFDKRLMQPHNDKIPFLIYCRDWTGSREYRLKFQELLYQHQLVQHSITGIKKINNCSPEMFTFTNPDFSVSSTDFFHQLPENTVGSSESADYCAEDFVASQISIVLETVFDDCKIHLTEKTLRPIACGHPFMIAAGPGSLAFLRSYGFKTFSPWIDESYDLESNSVCRMQKIIQAMKDYIQLSPGDRATIYSKLKEISDHNRLWFFSNSFFNCVSNELSSNIHSATTAVKKTRSTTFRARSKKQHLWAADTRLTIANCLRQIKKFNPPGR